MKFVAVIPARKGSKSIKNKNLILLKKKKLIEYTFSEIKKSKLKNEGYVLTDSKKIKKVAKKYNINNQYIRPNYLSLDTTSLVKTLKHFVKWISKIKKIDYLVVLQPTSPLRNYKDINNAILKLKKKKLLSLFSISQSLEHPYETISINQKSWSHVLVKAKSYYRRQDFNLDSYFINGAIYIVNIKLILKNKMYDRHKHGFYKMPKIRSFDINDREEIQIVKKILK